MIQGVIFDMDGLMFDTERIWATLWQPALATLGLPYKEGLDTAARGSAGDSMRAVLRRFYGPDCDTDAIMDALHRQADKAFQAPPPKKPGLDELIAWLEKQYIPMAVASSSRKASILHHLNGWNMAGHFQAILSGEQVTASSRTPRSSCWPQKLWAPPPPIRWCWRTATTASAPGPPGVSSPSWCRTSPPPTTRCAACTPPSAPACTRCWTC